MTKIYLFFLSLFFVACASKPQREFSRSPDFVYNYHELAAKDLDEMVNFVDEQLNSQKRGQIQGQKGVLTTLMTIYARPDDDGMIDKVVGPIRTEIEDSGSWSDALAEMVDLSTRALQAPDQLGSADQVSYAIVLQNIMAQLKPRLKQPGWERNLIIKIRDANLELTKEMRDERRLRMMKEISSPSEIAARLLGSKSSPEEIRD